MSLSAPLEMQLGNGYSSTSNVHKLEWQWEEVNWLKQFGFVPGGTLHVEEMTVKEAELKCLQMPGCRAFCHDKLKTFDEQQPSDRSLMYFKSELVVSNEPWTTHFLSQSEEAVWLIQFGFVVDDDLHVEEMSVEEAKLKCMQLPECQGFCHRGLETSDRMQMYFKSTVDVIHPNWGMDPQIEPWTTHHWYPKDVKWLMEFGFVPGGTLHVEEMTIEEAKLKCLHLPGCRAFCHDKLKKFEAQQPSDRYLMYFKSNSGVSNEPWTTHFLNRCSEEAVWLIQFGFVVDDDLHVEEMSVEEAKLKCMQLPACQGFCHRDLEISGRMQMYFKSAVDVIHPNFGMDPQIAPWTTHRWHRQIAPIEKPRELVFVVPSWSVSSSAILGKRGEEHKFKGKIPFEDCYDSVSKAVDALNASPLDYPDGLCVVFSSSKESYYFLWRSDKKDLADLLVKEFKGED